MYLWQDRVRRLRWPTHEQDLRLPDWGLQRGINGKAMTDDTYTLQLVLTNACNLSCRYCYVIPGRDSMPLSVACSAIDEVANSCVERNIGLTILFMGGEPLLEFNTMRTICEYAWEKYHELGVIFHSPTNGTLLNDEMRTWFTQHKERITLCLSFDGYLSQDSNRSHSLESVDVEFFAGLWPDQPIKMTVSESSLINLAGDIIKLHEKGINFGANCACGEAKWSAESIRLFEEQMMTLADYYNAHEDIIPCDLLNVDFLSVFQPRNPMLRRCGLGNNYVTVYIDGKKYPCHMFSPLALLPDKSDMYDFLAREDFTVKGCEECLLNQTCPKCYGMQYKTCGLPFRKDMNLCQCFKIQAKAAAVYNIRRLHNKEKLDEADETLLYAINFVMRRD